MSKHTFLFSAVSQSHHTKAKSSFSLLPADELIRQQTISCTERGLLPLRVGNEIRMCMSAYQTLYESSVAFGIRKVLQSEMGKTEMERKVQMVPSLSNSQ